MELRFLKINEKYGCFSNFSKHSFKLDRKHWPTSEHYFQAKKFEGTKWEEKVRKCKTAMDSKKMGRRGPLRKDWEDVKENIMYKGLKAKFTQNPLIKSVLLGTKDKKLIENATYDEYWGCGSQGKGKNRLGELLMKLRKEFK